MSICHDIIFVTEWLHSCLTINRPKGINMDSARYEAIILTERTGNLTETAQLMGYTQSGITRMIDTLERELGFKILVRSNKGVALTENGKTMLPLFREIVLACRNAEELASDIRGVLRGNVTIGTYYSAATIILPNAIKSFSEKYPGIKVDMMEGRGDELLRWMNERRVDMCICPHMKDSGFEWELLIKDRIMAWLPEDHEFKGKRFPLKRFENENVILTSPESGSEIDSLFAAEKLHINASFTTKDEYTAYNLVEAGLGIGINQEMVGSRWKGKVRMVPVSPARYVEIGLIHPPKKEMSPAARRFAESILSR